MSQGALNRKSRNAFLSPLGRYCHWTPNLSLAHRLVGPGQVTPDYNASGLPENRRSTVPGTHPVFASRKVFFNGVGYCSLSEAALGVLLERFVPEFRVVEGKTFQVPLGQGRSVDFLVNGVLIEYHELRVKTGRGRLSRFLSSNGHEKPGKRGQRRRKTPLKRERFFRTTCERLAAHYYWRRKDAIQKCAAFSQSELIVAISREEFYDKVLRRFATREVPSLGEFLALFWWWVAIIARQNGLPDHKKTRCRKVA